MCRYVYIAKRVRLENLEEMRSEGWREKETERVTASLRGGGGSVELRTPNATETIYTKKVNGKFRWLEIRDGNHD